MLKKTKDRRVAVMLALAGAVSPISGWHKFYLGQPGWGCLYLTLSLVTPWNPIPRIASVIEAVWYLFQSGEGFEQGLLPPLSSIGFGSSWGSASPIANPQQLSQSTNAQQMVVLGEALRELETLRQEGLISEYEFEQKRRQLLDAG